MFDQFLFYCVFFYERTQNFYTIHPLNISIAIWFNYRFDIIMITITNNSSMTIIFIPKLLTCTLMWFFFLTRALMWLIVSNRQLFLYELITLFTSLIIDLRQNNDKNCSIKIIYITYSSLKQYGIPCQLHTISLSYYYYYYYYVDVKCGQNPYHMRKMLNLAHT